METKATLEELVQNEINLRKISDAVDETNDAAIEALRCKKVEALRAWSNAHTALQNERERLVQVGLAAEMVNWEKITNLWKK